MKRLLNIKVTSIFSAKLESEGWADCIISLVDPTTEITPFIKKHHIEIFDDIVTPHDFYVLPTFEHVKRILDFTDKILDGQNLLIHCHAGISRSTAIALLVLCQSGFTPEQAVERVLEIRPQMWPNELVIQLGEEILGLNSELTKQVEKFKEENKKLFFLNGQWFEQ